MALPTPETQVKVASDGKSTDGGGGDGLRG